MKKHLLVLIGILLASVTAHAQYNDDTTPFSKGKVYVGASLTGLDLNYNSNKKWHLGLDARGGWLFNNNWMLLGTVGFEARHKSFNTFTLGAGARYYIEQNGLYLGAGANYVHESGIDDFRPTFQVGYAFFLNSLVSIEPELYYNQSLKNHGDYSGFGFRIGIGIYFE